MKWNSFAWNHKSRVWKCFYQTPKISDVLKGYQFILLFLKLYPHFIKLNSWKYYLENVFAKNTTTCLAGKHLTSQNPWSLHCYNYWWATQIWLSKEFCLEVLLKQLYENMTVRILVEITLLYYYSFIIHYFL